MDRYQTVGEIYYEPNGDMVIRAFGNPPEGFIFADGLEGGGTSLWSQTVCHVSAEARK